MDFMTIKQASEKCGICNASATKEKRLCRVSQDQIGNAGLACGAEDCAGNPERGRAEKRAAA